MLKYALSGLSMKRVTENDPHLLHRIPILGVQQGIAHDTRLPHKRKDMPAITENFRDAISGGDVMIWRLEKPVPAGGAVFLSPLVKENQPGYQVDDIIVREGLRGKGLGSALLQFTAARAQADGKEFIAWECEEGKPAEKMYRQIGATPRETVKPFRLTRNIIDTAIENRNDLCDPHDRKGARFNLSPRFSLFRTVNHGIEGYDMDPTQKSKGLQVEDLEFSDLDAGRNTLINVLKLFREIDEIDFVDIVIPTDSEKHLALIKSFDAQQNTYSGNPAYLWQLEGEAFANAAKIGKQIKVV